MRPEIDLFVDLDGVLADMDRHYIELFGANESGSREIPPSIFWRNIRSRPNFFAELQLMPDAEELWDGVRWFHPEPVILTGRPASIPGVEEQKREWVRQHFGSDVKVICCESKDKFKHGRPGDILIDDWAKFSSHWEAMGGVFVLHRSAQASLAMLHYLFARFR